MTTDIDNLVDDLLPRIGPPSETAKKQWTGVVPLEMHFQAFNEFTDLLRNRLKDHLKTGDCRVQDNDSLPQ